MIKHYVVLTRFSYTEPGHASSYLLPFEVDCVATELPRAYQAWMKSQVANEVGNDRHYGHKTVVAAFEATPLPAQAFTAAIKAAYAEIDAEALAAERAEAERDRLALVETEAQTETRERAEYGRLAAKFGPIR